VKKVKERIRKMAKSRDTQRSGRMRSGVLRVALVGYTNAGKSTLFNRITGAEALVANQLFATLDTTTRRIWIPEAGSVVLSDTVGFIRDLPHKLVAAFRATLEETVRADVLLHVVDAASPARDAQREQVNKVLEEIGAAALPQIEVWNKIDAIQTEGATAGFEPRVERDPYGKISRVFVSARTGAGLEALRDGLAEFARARAMGRGASQNSLHSQSLR
jgi:GTPase